MVAELITKITYDKIYVKLITLKKTYDETYANTGTKKR